MLDFLYGVVWWALAIVGVGYLTWRVYWAR